MLITCCKICSKEPRYWREKKINMDERIVFLQIILQGVSEALYRLLIHVSRKHYKKKMELATDKCPSLNRDGLQT